MKKSACICIGKILKPHGIKGELSIKFDIDWLKGRKPQKQKILFIEIYAGDELIPFFIEMAEADGSGSGRIKFEDYNSIESVRDLVNKEIFVQAHSFSPKTEGLIAGNELLGFSVSDKNSGTIGWVEDVLEHAKQQMLVVKNGEKEILIPLVKEFIVNVDKKERIIHMMIPEGITDINT